ncbi:hypothetical protein Tco_0869701 [Tanacetum coccineum]
MPLAYRASTSANPDPTISPAFVKANYEEYDKEREMEPRPTRARETTLVFRAGVESNFEGGRPSEKRTEDSRNHGMNLPPLLAAHLGRNGNGQPLHSFVTSVHGGHQPSINAGGISLLMALTSNHAPAHNGLMYPLTALSNNYHFYTQPIYSLPNEPAYPNRGPTSLFADSNGCITPFVHWIEDYPLPDGLKMPSHVESYDKKGDPDNYLHLFEGAIHMHKWAMPMACHMFTYTLKDSARIWWNDQKAGSILNYEDLKAKFRSQFVVSF